MSGHGTLLILDLIGAFGFASGLLVVIRRLRQFTPKRTKASLREPYVRQRGDAGLLSCGADGPQGLGRLVRLIHMFCAAH